MKLMEFDSWVVHINSEKALECHFSSPQKDTAQKNSNLSNVICDFGHHFDKREVERNLMNVIEKSK